MQYVVYVLYFINSTAGVFNHLLELLHDLHLNIFDSVLVFFPGVNHFCDLVSRESSAHLKILLCLLDHSLLHLAVVENHLIGVTLHTWNVVFLYIELERIFYYGYGVLPIIEVLLDFFMELFEGILIDSRIYFNIYCASIRTRIDNSGRSTFKGGRSRIVLSGRSGRVNTAIAF